MAETLGAWHESDAAHLRGVSDEKKNAKLQYVVGCAPQTRDFLSSLFTLLVTVNLWRTVFSENTTAQLRLVGKNVCGSHRPIYHRRPLGVWRLALLRFFLL